MSCMFVNVPMPPSDFKACSLVGLLISLLQLPAAQGLVSQLKVWGQQLRVKGQQLRVKGQQLRVWGHSSGFRAGVGNPRFLSRMRLFHPFNPRAL